MLILARIIKGNVSLRGADFRLVQERVQNGKMYDVFIVLSLPSSPVSLLVFVLSSHADNYRSRKQNRIFNTLAGFFSRGR